MILAHATLIATQGAYTLWDGVVHRGMNQTSRAILELQGKSSHNKYHRLRIASSKEIKPLPTADRSSCRILLLRPLQANRWLWNLPSGQMILLKPLVNVAAL